MRSVAYPLSCSPANTPCSAATTPWFQLSANAEKSKLKRHTVWDGDMRRKTVHVKNTVVHIMSVRCTHKRLKSHDPSKNHLSKLSQAAHASSPGHGGSLSLALRISASGARALKFKEISVEMLLKYRTALRIPSVAEHLITKHMQHKETCIQFISFMPQYTT